VQNKTVDVVFEGGGMQAVAYVGALRALEEKEITVRNIAAVSSATFPALGLAVGYSASELEELVFKTDFSIFAGSALSRVDESKVQSWIPSFLKEPIEAHLLFETLRLHKGFSDGQTVVDWINILLKKKKVSPSITFADLHKDLRIMTYDYTDDCERIFSRMTTPTASVVDAIRASTALFPIFRPLEWTDEDGTVHLLTDGGFINRFPIDIFDQEKDSQRHPPTLGFKLISEKRERFPNEQFFEYLSHYMERAMQNQEPALVKRKRGRRIIQIFVGDIQSIDFLFMGNDREKKKQLCLSGYRATKRCIRD